MGDIKGDALTKEEHKKQAKQQNVLLAKIGVTVFVTFVVCILFYFNLKKHGGLSISFGKITKAASPIIFGLVIAYLVNPIMKIFEKWFMPFFKKHCKTEKKAKKGARVLAIASALLLFVIIIVLLLLAIIPSVIDSVSGLAETLPDNVTDFVTMIQKGKFGNYEITDKISNVFARSMEQLEKWATSTILPQAKTYVVQITSGVISMIKGILDFVIGILVAAYVLMIKEHLIGQGKKIIFSVCKVRTGNIVIEMIRKADDIFGGFIIGKIIDSAIIGVICYIGCWILHIPDTVLVAVIVGVTNVIPVFGPFIGAIPSLILVVIQSPWHALYLLIFIIVLQQVDGNIIGPKILGSSTGLSTFWVMFSILIAGGLFGFFGMLLGVPVFAMFYYIVRRLVNHSVQKKNLPVATNEYVNISGIDEKTRKLKYDK